MLIPGADGEEEGKLTSDSINLDTNVRHQHGRGLLDRLSEWLPIWGGKVDLYLGLEGVGNGGFSFTEGGWLNGEFRNHAVEAGGSSVFGLDAVDEFAAGAGRSDDECSVGTERDRGGRGLKGYERGGGGVWDF